MPSDPASRPGTARSGRGRPGWHIECSAIALEYLGEAFDVQGGGSDLVFPHHEMCASEAQVAHRASAFAQAYVHAGMVGYDGEKMSKSRGNLVFVSALRNSDVDPMAIRLTLLRHHYRSDWEWTDAELWESVDLLDRWRRALALGAGAAAAAGRRRPCSPRSPTDLDAPAAVAAVEAGSTRPSAPTVWPRPATPTRRPRSTRSSTPPSASLSEPVRAGNSPAVWSPTATMEAPHVRFGTKPHTSGRASGLR